MASTNCNERNLKRFNTLINNEIKKYKCHFTDDEIEEIKKNEELLKEMESIHTVYHNYEVMTPSHNSNKWDMKKVDINKSYNVLSRILFMKNHRSVQYSEYMKDSYNYLFEDIKEKHYYLLDDKNVPHSETYLNKNINLRRIQRLIETNCFNGKKFSDNFYKFSQVIINNMKLPNEKHFINGFRRSITSLSFTDEGRKFIAGTRDGLIEIFNYNHETNEYMCEIKLFHDLPPNSNIIYSNKRNTTYHSDIPGLITEIDCKKNRRIDEISKRNLVVYIYGRHNVNIIKSICFKDSNEDSLICASMDGNVYGINIENSDKLFSVNGHYAARDVTMMSSDNPNLFASNGRKKINIYDTRLLGNNLNRPTPPICFFYEDYESLKYISSRGDGYYIAATCGSDMVKIYDIRYPNESIFSSRVSEIHHKQHEVANIRGSNSCREEKLAKAKFSPPSTGSRYIYTGDYNGLFSIFDLYSGECVKSIHIRENAVIKGCDWSEYGNDIIISVGNGEIINLRHKRNIPIHEISDLTRNRMSRMESHGASFGDSDEEMENYVNETSIFNELPQIRINSREYRREFPPLGYTIHMIRQLYESS
uniref:WD_REPEATS_REGION domain-containing protein n=1 Tax=Parastrongyloides trichosuri TaxID=131310 RepID=A0A0N4Z6G1_PARTI